MNIGKRRYELTGFQLKLIAIVTMTFDHIGVFFITPPFYYIFRVVGRIAFPIFCYLITEGFIHTRDIKKYMVRLSVLAVVSETILDKCFYDNFFYLQSQSVLILFVIALFSLNFQKKVIEKYHDNIIKKSCLIALIVLLFSVITIICKTEYGILGFLMILSSYYFKETLPVLVAAFLACNFLSLDSIQAFGGLAVLPIILYNGKQGRKIGLWAYLYYPFHIIVLYIVVVILGMQMKVCPSLGKEVIDHTVESNEKLEDMTFDEETILFIGQLPSESDGDTEKYKSITLEQNGTVILLNNGGEPFKIRNKSALKVTADIINDGSEKKLNFGVIQNSKFVNLQTIKGQELDITLDTAFDNSYLMLINESGHSIQLDNCKIELR